MIAKSAVMAAGCLLSVSLAPAGDLPIGSELAVGGLNHPTNAVAAPGDYTRIYITEKRGTIRIANIKTDTLLPGFFLDIQGIVGTSNSLTDERGLLGLAFHPEYEKNGFFYVYYSTNASDAVVARYTMTGDQNNVDESTGTQVMFLDQPFTNHNGGWIGFGPNDGYLYIATGDGGSAGDPGDRAQDITNMLLGKMLRIDVDGGFPYAIPADNPFVGVTGDDEIWAYGLRNPWRCDFDNASGDLYIADVGQNVWEEVNVQLSNSEGGENYGWRCYEGNHNFNTADCPAISETVQPVHEYSHGSGCSISGGHVYRGCKMPGMEGIYFFADWCSDSIWSFRWSSSFGVTEFQTRTGELAPTSGSIINIAGFGEDLWGELYIIEQDSSGELFRIVPDVQQIADEDINCDGGVNVLDLLLMLNQWGPGIGKQADINGDDAVNVTDFLLILNAWG